MTKGRNTATVSFRIPDEQYFAIQQKATRKGLSIGDYTKHIVLKEALREHKKQGVKTQ